MKQMTLILMIMALVLFSTVTTVFIFQRNQVMAIYDHSMDVKITDDGVSGFNIDNDALHFGSFAAGSKGRRWIEIRDIGQVSKIKVVATGEMAEWLSYEDGMIIDKGADLNLTFLLSVPKETPVGNYTGKVRVLLKKP